MLLGRELEEEEKKVVVVPKVELNYLAIYSVFSSVPRATSYSGEKRDEEGDGMGWGGIGVEWGM
jgi:hypothetical protein